MSDRSAIEWCDASWSPVRGCAPVSAGCANCYAARMAHRFSGPGKKPYEGLTRDGKWTGEVRLVPKLLYQPLRWRKPRRIFVGSMSDLFHEAVPWDFIDAIFGVMALCSRHAFQVLTKRPARMRNYLANSTRHEAVIAAMRLVAGSVETRWSKSQLLACYARTFQEWEKLESVWPLPNVHLGISAENQEMLDRRVPDLLATPEAVRFVSAEPLIEELNLRRFFAHSIHCAKAHSMGNPECRCPRLHWVIVGGESGPGARPCKIEWVRSIVEQCHNSDVPCFVKRLPGYPKDMATWPAWSQVREWPDHRSQGRSIAQPGASSEASG